MEPFPLFYFGRSQAEPVTTRVSNHDVPYAIVAVKDLQQQL